MEKREQSILGQIFESLTQFEDIDAVRRQLVKSLSELAEADAGHLFSFPPASAPESATWARLHADSLHRQFESCFERDPLCQRMLRSVVSVGSQSDFEGALAWCESPLYREVLNPLGFHDGALLLLRTPQGTSADSTQVLGSVRWCVWLGHHRRNGLSRRRLRLLEDIAPQLYTGLNNLCAWHERWKRSQAIESMLHFTDDLLACVAVGGDCPRLIAATRAVQEVLGLDPSRTGANPALREFLELAAGVQAGKTSSSVWNSSVGRAYKLMAMPASEQGDNALRLVRLEALAAQPGAAVRNGGAPAAAAEDVHAARVAGLSARKAAVFAHMSRGLGNREIAQDLGISIDTVRAHLRNIFAKLEVCSRVEAVNAVRNRTREDLLRAKLDSTIDTPASETNVHTNAGAGHRARSAELSNLPEPSTHGHGITAQIT